MSLTKRIKNHAVVYTFIYEKITKSLSVEDHVIQLCHEEMQISFCCLGFSEGSATGFSSSWLLPAFMVNAS